jgi:hypothetical protein
MNPIDKAHNLIPKMKDWPPMKDRKTVDVYELCGVDKPLTTQEKDQVAMKKPQ